MAFTIEHLRKLEPAILCIGSHHDIIQSIFDFDYLQGRPGPSIQCVIASGRRHERYFFGDKEVLLPVYESVDDVPQKLRAAVNLFINLSSGRRVLPSTREIIKKLPGLIGGSVFAERVPERHALELAELSREESVWVLGGASVGLIVANHLKLGAIGGIQAEQLIASRLFDRGHIAVISSSGGMVNEIIRSAALAGAGISFAAAIGGERFPMVTPRDAFLAAEADPLTKAIVYFGELGESDEYEIAELLSQGVVTKPMVAYIAGVVAELFETPQQFGHAKAMAESDQELASTKQEALRAAGAHIISSFGDLPTAIAKLKLPAITERGVKDTTGITNRTPSLITSSISYEVAGETRVLGADLLTLADGHSFAFMVASLLLGKPITSKEMEKLVDCILRLLVDHGPNVSGAVNTIITARAGKDLVSSLVSGLLTIGPRFGGAINEAAATWLHGVNTNRSPVDLVEDFASNKRYISGIGHRKYRTDLPDPRVAIIAKIVSSLPRHKYTDYAQAVERETTRKKGSLILNVDGAIAAALLDTLAEAEGYTAEDLKRLVEIEFFNALFVLSRSVGFMAHYFDQRRLDEGIFRLSQMHINTITPSE